MFDAYSEVRLAGHAAKMDSNIREYWSEEADGAGFALVSSLSHESRRDAIELYEAQSEVSIRQHPEWDRIVHTSGDIRYFTYYKKDKLMAYAVIRFPTSRIARVEFGPVAESGASSLEAIRRIVKSVRETSGCWYLSLQLPWQTGEETDRLEEKLRSESRIKSFDDKRNWSSSIIDTDLSNDEIRKSFSKNHRRSLNKAEKLGLTARSFDSDEEIYTFNEIYARMYKTRGESIDKAQNLRDYLNLRDFFKRTGQGFFYGVYRENDLIGGMIIVRQGLYGFYHHSASDPEHRKIPVQHKGVVSVLDALRDRGIRYFDFGGYNHMVDKTDQVYNINRFKDGFTKQYIYYPKIMFFEFVPNAVGLLDRFDSFKQLVKKAIRR